MSAEPMKNSGVEWIGNIPQEWSISRLKDCLEIRNGKEVETDGGDIPVYGSGGVFGSTTSFLHDGESILFGRKGTIDKPLLAAGEFWTVDTMFYSVLRGNDNLKYLYYAALCLDFKSRQSGSTLPSMTQTALGGFFIPRPKLQEQQIIAAVLDEETGKIDHALSLLRQELETLEQLKKSLIYEAVTKGLDPSVRMKPSGVDWIGDIPEHWSYVPLNYLFSIVGGNGFSLELQGSTEGDLPFFKNSDISSGTSRVFEAANYISSEVARNEGFNLVPPKSVLMGKIGESMRKNRRVLNTVTCCIDNNMQAMVPIYGSVVPEFGMYALQILDASDFNNGGPVPSINNIKWKRARIPLPSPQEQQVIVTYLNDWYKRLTESISLKQEQIELLQDQRKSLIFEYVTGKQRVNEVM